MWPSFPRYGTIFRHARINNGNIVRSNVREAILVSISKSHQHISLVRATPPPRLAYCHAPTQRQIGAPGNDAFATRHCMCRWPWCHQRRLACFAVNVTLVRVFIKSSKINAMTPCALLCWLRYIEQAVGSLWFPSCFSTCFGALVV